MPHLQELQDKYQSKGFTVVGSHRQGLSPRVKQFLEEKNISFPVYQGLDIPAASCPGGLPHAVLIGANGKVVAKGYPPELYDLVKKEVLKAERGLPILEDVELNKYKSLEMCIRDRHTRCRAAGYGPSRKGSFAAWPSPRRPSADG